MNFEELDLNKATLEQLKETDLDDATSLQETIIRNATQNQSLVIKAEDAEDKQTAFAIVAHHQLQSREDEQGTSVLIITDTAENAHAISDKLTKFGIPKDDCILADNAGESDEQSLSLDEEPAVIIANPEQLQTLLKEHRYIFRKVDLFILDELDSMIDGGQSDNLKRIKRRVLSDYTTLVCAREYNSQLKNVASSFANDPTVIGFSQVNEKSVPNTPPAISGKIKQEYINVPYRMKISTLMAHLDDTEGNRFVIFTASKRGTDRLYRVLKKRGLKATSLHGKLSDEKRHQRFSNFTGRDVQFLLVADISAAALNVDEVDQVINYDVPNSSDEYRFRAALLGSNPSARLVSLVSKQDRSDISELQNELGETPDEIPLPDKVKEKLKKRRQNKSSNGQKKPRGKQKKHKKKKEMELPRPSYDKLSGGRTGNHDDEKTGIVKFFKKLFT